MKATIFYILLASCAFAADIPFPFDDIKDPPKKVSSLPLPSETGISPKLDPKKESPYNWIVDNIREVTGKQVHFAKAVLSYGFEHSALLRDVDQKGSAISVVFDHDLIRADREFPGSWDDFLAMQSEMMKNTRYTFYYELTAVVEVRPFPKMRLQEGGDIETGYGHMGAYPFQVVVKRIYSLKEIKRVKNSE